MSIGVTSIEHGMTAHEQDRATAMLIAVVIRNAMENFHVKHLSDAQMRELNPIIRNAVFTALHALRNASRSPGAHGYLQYQSQHIPHYWEEPQLLTGYRGALTRRGEDLSV